MEATMVGVNRRALMLSVAAAGATLADRPAVAQSFSPNFGETLDLVKDPVSTARLEMDFWLFAPLVVEALYQTGELPESNVATDKSQMFAEGLYPQGLFSALSESRDRIASAMERTGALPLDDRVPAGAAGLAERLKEQGVNPEAPIIARALTSPVHVARIAPFGPRTGLFSGFEPCKIWVIGLICRLV